MTSKLEFTGANFTKEEYKAIFSILKDKKTNYYVCFAERTTGFPGIYVEKDEKYGVSCKVYLRESDLSAYMISVAETNKLPVDKIQSLKLNMAGVINFANKLHEKYKAEGGVRMPLCLIKEEALEEILDLWHSHPN